MINDRQDPRLVAAATEHGEELILMYPTGSTMITAIGWSRYSSRLFTLQARQGARERLVLYEWTTGDVYADLRTSRGSDVAPMLLRLVEAEGVPSRAVEWHDKPLEYCYALSDDGSYSGSFASRLEALGEAACEAQYDYELPPDHEEQPEESGAYIGYSVPIPLSEFAAVDWVERLSERAFDNFSEDYVEDWAASKLEAVHADAFADLDRALAAIVDSFAHRYRIHPTWYDVGGSEWLSFELLRDGGEVDP